jgi:type II secretion system protein G
MRNLINKKNRGFTLIELLVVIAIIGILAAVVLVSLNSARQKSRDARRLADVRQIMTALEIYYNDNGGYPANSTQTIGGKSVSAPTPSSGTPAFSTYLGQYPTYPQPSNDGSCGTTDNYTYTQLSSGNNYSIVFCTGSASGGFSGGTHTASQAGLQ